jgi:hypothetical protein
LLSPPAMRNRRPKAGPSPTFLAIIEIPDLALSAWRRRPRPLEFGEQPEASVATLIAALRQGQVVRWTVGKSVLACMRQGRTRPLGLRRRTPAPPPFSSMNSMPAFSSALCTPSSVLGYGSLAPRSKSAMVFMAVLLASARSDCDHPRSPRAPRHCAGLMYIFYVTLPFLC